MAEQQKNLAFYPRVSLVGTVYHGGRVNEIMFVMVPLVNCGQLRSADQRGLEVLARDDENYSILSVCPLIN